MTGPAKRPAPRRDCRAIHVDPFELWIFLIQSVRYSMGRSTTAPSAACDAVRRYSADLAPHQRRQILNEVAREIADCEAAGRRLGDECDHAEWTRLCTWLRANP